MELRLQKFISSMATLADIRNLDPFNPIILLMEHPVTAIQYTIIVSIVEPSYMGIPLNCIWVCMDSTLASYKNALKLKTLTPDNYEGEQLVDGFKQGWLLLSRYDEIFSDPQYYDNGSGGGIPGPQGPQGEQGVQGIQGPRGATGAQGEMPTLDYAAIAVEVAKLIGSGTTPTKSLSIVGVDSIIEGGNGTYVVNLVSGSDIIPISVQLVATVNAPYVTIDASNKVVAKAITADTSVTLSVSYVADGVTLTASKIITLINAALSSISLTGLAATIFENKTAQLAVTAAYSNSTNAAVTSNASYVVAPTSAGSVSASGVFTANEVTTDTPFTITASYVEGGVTKTSVVSSTVKNIVVSSIAINGATSINEKTTSQFTVTATKNDGTTSTVAATLAVSDAAAGSIDASGLFTAADVSADTTANITASYTLEGVTVTATKAITTKNVVAAITPFFGVASTTAAKDSSLILSLTGRGPSAARQMNPCSMTSGAGQSYYYAYPVSYGAATFIDLSNGFEGGMDGAHGDKGQTLGPIAVNVTIDGVVIPFYLYASDQSNLGLTNWNVT